MCNNITLNCMCNPTPHFVVAASANSNILGAKPHAQKQKNSMDDRLRRYANDPALAYIREEFLTANADANESYIVGEARARYYRDLKKAKHADKERARHIKDARKRRKIAHQERFKNRHLKVRVCIYI